MMEDLLRTTLDQMWEEVMGASSYMDKYQDYKESCPSMAVTFLEIAPVELAHYEKLKQAFKSTVDQKKARGDLVDEEILIIWSFDMKRLEEQAQRVKYAIESAKRA